MTDVAVPDEQTDPPVTDDREAQDLLALLQRERADFLNFRRRTDQDRGAERLRAQMDLVRGLLPLLDDLNRALSNAPQDLKEHPWTHGVLLSRQRLLDFLTRAGLESFGAPGDPFAPALHEAVFFEHRHGNPATSVETVIRPGYRLGDRVVQPAQVGVVGPGEENERPAADSDPAADRR